MGKYDKAEAPRALSFRADPTDGLLQAMSDPALRVPPPLPTSTSGHLHASPVELVAWLVHHDLPVPDELAHAMPKAQEHHLTRA